MDHISERIASNPATPIKFLEELLRELPAYSGLNYSIACNPNLPLKTFENIVKDADWYDLLYISDSVHMNKLSYEILEEKLKRTSYEVAE